MPAPTADASPEQAPFRLGFRVCDRRYPFLWDRAGQPAGRWNLAGDQPVHTFASSPTVAWVEWLRNQEISDPADLQGIAAALWAVLIPAAWGPDDLPSVELPIELVLDNTEEAQEARLALVDQLKRRGAQGLKAPSAALANSAAALLCWRVRQGSELEEVLPVPAEVLLLWCPAEQLVGWCCVREGSPGPELLPLVRHRGV